MTTTSYAIGRYGAYMVGDPVCYNTAIYGWLDGTVTHVSLDDYHHVALARIELRHQERIIALTINLSSLDLVPAAFWDKP